MMGVIIAQMMRLQHSLHPNPDIGFFVVSVPLSVVCHGSAILISVLGAIRFFHWQKEMDRGHSLVGGWELHSVGVLCILVCAGMDAIEYLLTSYRLSRAYFVLSWQSISKKTDVLSYNFLPIHAWQGLTPCWPHPMAHY